MKSYRLLLLILTTFISSAAFAQTNDNHPEYDTVMSVVDGWIGTLRTGDLDLRAKLTIDGALTQQLVEQDDGSFKLESRTRNNSSRQTNPNVMIERYWDHKLLIEDKLAVFWAPYDFWVNGEFTHCGTDVFDLIKIDGEWKLGNMMYTIQRTNCLPSPLGELN